MRISHITATDLFGTFNHEIPLNLEDRITIILGPNGLGKTVILRMLDGVINSRYAEFRRVPFHQFRLDFVEPTSALQVFEGPPQPSDAESNSPSPPKEIWLEYKPHDGNSELHQIAPRDMTEGRSLPLSIIEDEVAGLERISSRTWRYLPTLETLNLDDVLERFSDQLPAAFTHSQATPDWLRAIRSDIHVRLVETQRLVGSPGPSNPIEQRIYRHGARTELPQAVSMYSRELSAEIQSVLAESAELSQNLDSSFPRRVINQGPVHPFTAAKLRQELDQLEQKRTYLYLHWTT